MIILTYTDKILNGRHNNTLTSKSQAKRQHKHIHDERRNSRVFPINIVAIKRSSGIGQSRVTLIMQQN